MMKKWISLYIILYIIIIKIRKGCKIHSFLLSAILFAFLFFPAATHALGITPIFIEVDNALQNSRISRKFYVSRANPSKDEMVKVAAEGEAASYIAFPNEGIFKLPKGENNTPINFEIVTGKLGTGTYTAVVRILPTTEKSDNKTTGSSVVVGGQMTVQFTVTNAAIEKYEISNISITDTEEKQRIGFAYNIINIGNVDAKPTKIEIKISDVSDPSFVYTETFSGEQIPFSKAMESKTINILSKAQLEIGSYTATTTFFAKDNVIFEGKQISFQILARGTLSQSGKLESFTTPKKIYAQGELVEFLGTFMNDGKIGVTTNLVVDILKNDIKLDLIKSESEFVPPNGTQDFKITWRPQKNGTYTTKGYAIYNGKITNQFEINFDVGGAPSSKNVFLGLGAFIILLIIGIFVWIMRTHHQSKHHKNKKNHHTKHLHIKKQ